MMLASAATMAAMGRFSPSFFTPWLTMAAGAAAQAAFPRIPFIDVAAATSEAQVHHIRLRTGLVVLPVLIAFVIMSRYSSSSSLNVTQLALLAFDGAVMGAAARKSRWDDYGSPGLRAGLLMFWQMSVGDFKNEARGWLRAIRCFKKT